MHNTFKTTIYFLDLGIDVAYNYYPGESPTFNNPGCPESIEWTTMWLAGKRLTDEQFQSVLDAYSAEALVDTIFEDINRMKQNKEEM